MNATPPNQPGRPNDPEDGTPTPDSQPEPRSSVPSLLFLTFVLFMLTGGRGDDISVTRNHYLEGLQSLKFQLSNYSAWLNGTESNFTLPVQDPNTRPLVGFFMTSGGDLDPRRASYYTNFTGFWHGELEFRNLTALSPTELTSPWRYLAENYVSGLNTTDLPDRAGSWNWTNSEKVSLSMGDKLLPYRSVGQDAGMGAENFAIVHGKIDLTDPNASEELRLDFEGIHVLSTGAVYAAAEGTGRPIDIRTIPSLVPESFRNDSARAIETEIETRITKLEQKIDTGALDQDASGPDDSPKTRCSFKLFGQLEASPISRKLMDELESEIEKPTGIWTVRPPEMTLNGVLVSQDCGIMYRVSHAVGLQSPRLYRKISTYSGIASIVSCILLILYRRQVVRSSSAAGLSRVSRYTFLAQSLIDAISFVGHVTLGILADGRPSLSVLAPAGFACLLFIYEAQFAVLIGSIQAPEDVAPTPAPASQPTPAAAQAGTTPTPQPTTPGPPSFLRFFWNHIRTDPAARLWTIISLCLIFVFRLVIFLSLPVLFVSAMYSSVWLFQIARSARRGRGSGLSAEYLLGTTLCRLFFACYFLGCPKNILDIEPRRWIFGIAAFMIWQVLLVMMQDRFDPAFFLPRRATVQNYDYHPVMTSSAAADAEAPEQSLGDCAICMDKIVLEVGERQGLRGIGARKSYSLAPCHHLFHTTCLERWLAIKNICPQCRRPLPPL